MNSERSNKGKEKLIEDDDHCPSQNNLPGSDNQQQNFGGGRGATEAAVSATADGSSCSHSASEKQRTELLPLSDFVDQINPHHLQWTEKLHNHFVHAMEELGRRGKKVTPKTLTKAMAIDGLTQQHVKSRLQAFRQRRITETNWQAPRGPRRKNNKAGKIDGQKSARSSASTSTQEHERNGPGMGDQNSVGLQFQTPGFLDHNGFFYPFHPGNEYHWAQLEQYCEVLQVQTPGFLQIQTPGFQDHNGFFYPFHPGNEYHWAQLEQYCEVATDTVQAQNATAITPDNMVTTEDLVEDFLNLGSSELDIADFEIDFELALVVHPAEDGVPSCLYNQNEVPNIQAGNETHRVQQPAQDGGALGNIQQQNQPQAATDIVEAQIATAITQDIMEPTEDPMGNFLRLDSPELTIADLLEQCGLTTGQPL